MESDVSSTREAALRLVPRVDVLLTHPAIRSLIEEFGREVVLGWVRVELDEVRGRLRASADDAESEGREGLTELVADRVAVRADAGRRGRLGPVINATGVVLHTGLGRAALSAAARTALGELAGAGNIEVDLESGERRYRGHQLAADWQALCGAEDSLVVNNNAAATLLTLQALCAGREVIISRGQLIEIGGSFRLPDIFELSGAILHEVGTTNRTRLADYASAIGPETAAIMHVHPSNFRVIGFAETPEIGPLAALAHEHELLAIDDIGSGAMVDMTRFGLPAEPTFADSLADGADVVLGSGDKLLGGPQAGIMLGRQQPIERIRRHPLARAVRVGKLTLAALAATLESYRRGAAEQEIPVLAMLAAPVETLVERAEVIRAEIAALDGLEVELRQDTAVVGGGSLPGAELPTAVLSVTHREFSVEHLAATLRTGTIRLFTRVQHDRLLVDLRSVLPQDDSRIVLAMKLAVAGD